MGKVSLNCSFWGKYLEKFWLDLNFSRSKIGFCFGQGFFLNKVQNRTGRRSRQDKMYVRNLAEDLFAFSCKRIESFKAHGYYGGKIS